MDEKTRDERIAELLDKPAIEGMQGPSLASNLVDEPKVEQPTEEESEDEVKDKKVRVRASKLNALSQKVQELEAQLQETSQLKEQFAALKQNPQEDLPDWWKEAYGDSEASRKGYQSQLRVMNEAFEREFARREELRQAVEAEREARIETIEQSFDDQMDALEDSIGRDLTDNQKAEIMDIVGDYSPQEDGQYVGYMPISKAYEIWQSKSPKNESKQEMAKIASLQSSGSQAAPDSRPLAQQDWRTKWGL